MVNIEDLSKEELDHLYKFYIQISELAEKEDDITCTHSIDAAEENHQSKINVWRGRKSYQGLIKLKTRKISNGYLLDNHCIRFSIPAQ
jgi:hypothetical protein